jgi:uncharacterized membrane protein
MLNYIDGISLIFLLLFPIIVFIISFKILTYVFQRISLGFSISWIIATLSISLMVASFIFTIDPTIFFLFSYNQWHISIHLIGFGIPLFIIFIIIKKQLFSVIKLISGLIIISIISYFITIPIPEQGIISPFPFWLFPSFLSSIIAIYQCKEKNVKVKSAYAYSIGVLGVLIGADICHLPQLLYYQQGPSMNAIIGGAAFLDLIFITGVISVLIIQLYYSIDAIIMAIISLKKIDSIIRNFL